MKQLLKYLGIIFVFIAVLLLIFSVISGISNNTYLLISGVLLVVGLLAHVVLNKKLE